MPSTFTKVITGALPARFVWRDDRCVAFLDAAPLTEGHVLVVPIDEIDKWTDAPSDLMAHLWEVVGIIGRAQMRAFPCRRIGVMIVGYEIPHLHVHTFPSNGMADFDFAGKDQHPDPAMMDRAASALRRALVDAGFAAQAGDAAVQGEHRLGSTGTEREER